MDPDTQSQIVFFDLGISIMFIIGINFFSVLQISLEKLKTNQSEDIEDKIIKKIDDDTKYYSMSIKFLKLVSIVVLSVHVNKSFMYLLIDKLYLFSNLMYLKKIITILFAIMIACIVMCFCELIPKKLASLKMKRPLFLKTIYFTSLVSYPFLKFIFFISSIFLKIFKTNLKDLDTKVSEEEIKALVETASQKGVFNDIERDMINSIFSFDDIMAKDIMVSRKDTYKIDIEDDFTDNVDELLNSYYSRIPVYEEDIDNIIGILNVKDLTLEARRVGFENINLKKLLKEPYFVPEMKNIDQLFRDMQKLRIHMAILVDEYGGFSGIVTIEDMIEQIMGDINDEFDDEEVDIKKISEYVYEINGTTEIREINKALNLDLENENYDIISALIIEKLGYIPKDNEKPILKIDNLIFKVQLALDNRIEKLKLIIRPKEEKKF